MKRPTIKNNLKKLLNNTVYTKVPLSQLTSYKVGGPADYLVFPKNVKELLKIIEFINTQKIKTFIIGNGTNLLASEKGFKGIIIALHKLKRIKFDAGLIEVEAGAGLDDLIVHAIKRELAGLENLSWIPGTVGGGLRMNAGAYGNEISDYLIKVQVMDWQGTISWIDKTHVGFGYRKANKLKDKIIIKAVFKLHTGNHAALLKQRRKIIALRKLKQPWEYPSAGSVFKRPKGFYAGTLISQAGLSGYRIGGAEVSTKHSGFIINKGRARPEHIRALIKHIQETVYKKFHVQLELEQILLA